MREETTNATANHLSIDDSARLFALVNLAMGDAAITAWDTKLHFVFWRPVTAIHEGDNDGNPDTIGDPDWQPLINTPNYPDYTGQQCHWRRHPFPRALPRER